MLVKGPGLLVEQPLRTEDVTVAMQYVRVCSPWLRDRTAHSEIDVATSGYLHSRVRQYPSRPGQPVRDLSLHKGLR